MTNTRETTQQLRFDWESLLDGDPAMIIAREYLRVSFDDSGRQRSNEEQHADNLKAMGRERYTLGDSYSDVGSASKYAKRRRADWDQLIADLSSGAFGAHVLILWEPSRGSREVWEWARLLSLCESTGVRIYVTQDRRLYDPTTPGDWKHLMDAAVDAEHESRKSQHRIKRATNANGAAGSFSGGRRPFGYEADGVTINHAEAKIIRDLVRKVLAGASVRSLAAELNARTPVVTTTAGNPWRSNVLKGVLVSPRIAGLRVHKGVVTGKATWTGIIDVSTHKRVVATLNSRTPVGRRGRTTWLLTGLLTCERCTARLVANTDIGGTRRYVCRKGTDHRGCGGLGISAKPVERLLADMVVARYASLDARRSAASELDEEELVELDRVAMLRDEADDDRFAERIDRAEYDRRIARLDARQRDIEARLAAKIADVAPLDFVIDSGLIGRKFDELNDEEAKRYIAAAIRSVRVGPSTLPRGSNQFDEARIDDADRIDWRV